MSLGDWFSDDLKKNFAERNINIGNSLLIKLTDLDVRHDKYIIIVGINNDEMAVAYVIINTEINQNVYPTPYLQSLHLTIDCARHTFLDYDSHVNCAELREFEKEKLIDFIVANPERVLGSIETDLLTEIYNTIKDARTILPILKKKYGFI